MKTFLHIILLILFCNLAKAQVTTINATLANPCSTLNVNEIPANENIKIYPNPNKGLVTINFDENTILENVSIKVFDIIGKLIYESKNLEIINNSLNINLENATNGVYFITIQNKEKITSKKLIINK